MIKTAEKIEMWEVERLTPYAKNSRTHSEEQISQIVESIKEFGFTNPILVDAKNEIIAGHGRLMAASKAGMLKVPVIVLGHLTDIQKRAYVIADNKLALNAGWDFEILTEEIKHLEQDGFDLDLLGFSDDELNNMMPEIIDPQSDEDDAPAVIADPKVVPGEIYILGKHRLMCGDSTNIQHVEKLMNGVQVDLVVTDPPYNVAVNDESEESLKARNRRTDGLTIANDKMSEEDFRQFLISIFSNYHMVMKDGAAIYVFYADSMTIPFMSTFMECDFHFAQNCIWNKQQFVMTRKDYHYKHEPVMYGWKKGAAHPWYTDRKQSSVWNFDRPFKNELHPTMKPINLIEYPVENSSKIGDAVLDLFGGSGSTLIACEKTNRRNYSMELDPKYCAVILERWQNYTGKLAMREDGTPWNEIKGS